MGVSKQKNTDACRKYMKNMELLGAARTFDLDLDERKDGVILYRYYADKSDYRVLGCLRV